MTYNNLLPHFKQFSSGNTQFFFAIKKTIPQSFKRLFLILFINILRLK